MKKKLQNRFVSQIFETQSDTADWFGYYNYDTLNYDQTKMLCNKSPTDGCAIERGMEIELGYYDIPEGTWHHIGVSDSYNWQQGAMLQWLPGKGNENKVIYNFSKDNHFKSCIYDIVTGEEKIIDYPIYGIAPDGKRAIALNYERSYWCRAYHYQSVVNPEYDVRVAEDDGVFEVDLEHNTVSRIVDIYDVINMEHEECFDEAKHWLEHIMISPDGSKFVFLHRFSLGVGYATRICIVNIDGSSLQVIGNWHKYDWSHFGWKGSNEFVIYTVESIKLTKSLVTPMMSAEKPKRNLKLIAISAIKKVIPKRLKAMAHKRYYQHYVNQEGRFVLEGVYNCSALRIDGHPSFTEDERYMITDSYPFEDGFRHLIVYDTKTGKACVLAKLYAALWGNPASCDLHPKLCKNNNYVVVDTAYTGKHCMICFKINWANVKEVLNGRGKESAT